MSKDYEKGYDSAVPPSGDVDSYPDINQQKSTGLYDPSKESAWTRAGLTLESFKRAPGTTGYVLFHFYGYSQPKNCVGWC